MAKAQHSQRKLYGVVLSFMSFGVVASLIWVYVLPYHFSPQRHRPLEQSGQFDSTDQAAVFHGTHVKSPELAYVSEQDQQVLGSHDPGVEKTIEVDLSKQMLYAKEDGETVAEFQVSTGKWGRTPTGEFDIWIKLVSTKMSGGSKALGTYYYLPNVPYTMFFYNSVTPQSDGFGIHGAYWHSNFGEPMSHGCVNMRPRDVEKLFYWANPEMGDSRILRSTKDNPGTKVIIYGEAPEE